MATMTSDDAIVASSEQGEVTSNSAKQVENASGEQRLPENGEQVGNADPAIDEKEKSATHAPAEEHHAAATEAPEACCAHENEGHDTENGDKSHENGGDQGAIDAETLERDRRLSDEVSSLSLNPLAEEFRPPKERLGACVPPTNVALASANGHSPEEHSARRSQSTSTSTNEGSSDRDSDARQSAGRHLRAGKRTKGKKHVNMESVRRTVYVCDIENSVTEEQLASLFSRCGQVIDCRICGDPNSALRFAFVEFTTEASAGAALMLNGAILNYQQLQVLPSKTPIVPVNPVFLPQSQNELETCSRTIYVTNIDRIVDRKQMNCFFEQTCGPISKSRLLGQSHHPTRIAFIEFARADSAMGALNCSGAMLGGFPIRVSPSKTPVRLRNKPDKNGSRKRSSSGTSSSTTTDTASSSYS